MKKLRYTDDCERRCKYGKLTKGVIIEVPDDDYPHFASLAFFEPLVAVKPERYKASRMVHKVREVHKMVVDPDFETEKE